jgi:intracellular multiplication protein IcmK
MVNRLRKLIIASLLLMLSGSQQCVLAQDQPGSSNANINSSAPPNNIAQFQDWLKNNGQSASGQRNLHAPPPPLRKKVVTQIFVPDENAPVISPPLSMQQSQNIMLKSAPQSPPPGPEAEAAFNDMLQKNAPLTPEQVVKLRQYIDRSQRAASIPANVPPKPVSTTLMINLAPGTTPPAIRLAQGYVSSLVFVDSSGSPWPVASYDAGDPKATSIQWDGKSNVMLVQAVAPYSDSNLVIRLVGLPTPITLELVSGQRVVDYRADIHVSGLGPNTKDLPTGVALPPSASQLLLNILDGVSPAGSKTLTVTGGDCQAWLFGDKMYLRTRLTILSPGWIGKMVSPDGMNAYEIQKTSSVLVSQYGEPIELKIEGF